MIVALVAPLPGRGLRHTADDSGTDTAAAKSRIAQPHRILAFGFAYFLYIGVARMLLAPVAG